MDKINFQNGILVAKAKVTINGTVYEVEPEEYEGETPLSAEILNEMQDNIENAINTVQNNLNTTNQNIENLTTYSTTEKVVGTWIDGKTLYEITLTGTKNAGADLIIDVSNLNIENFFFAGGGLKSNAGIGYELSRSEPNGVWTRAQINDDLTSFHFTSVKNLGVDYVTGVVTAILRYTKTTD